MMKKRVALVLLAAVFVFTAMAFAGTYKGKIFHNSIGTSGIQIRVSQMQETPDGLQEISGTTMFAPGEERSYVPRVKVIGMDSYVRLQFLVKMEQGSSLALSADDVYGLGEDWIRKGDWFYCRKILKPDETSDVFRGIRIPDFDLGECGGFRTRLVVDAIQAANFHPDFESDAPWGSVTIQASSVTDGATVRNVSAAESGSTAANGTAESGGELGDSGLSLANKELIIEEDNRIVCEAGDLFQGFGSLSPGDSKSDHLTIRNRSGSHCAVYFSTQNENSALLDEVELQLTCGGKSIYEGPLVSDALRDKIQLTSLDCGATADFRYTVSLPETKDNSFQEMADQIVWMFEADSDGPAGQPDNATVQPRDDVTAQPDDSAKATAEKPNDSATEQPDDNAAAEKSGEAPWWHAVKTGDQRFWRVMMAAVAGTLALVLLTVLVLRRGRHERDNQNRR